MADLLLNLILGVVSSILTVGLMQYIKRKRIIKIYRNIVGIYKEVDNSLLEKYGTETYEVSFNFNFLGNAPELTINFFSGEEGKANWRGVYYISSPSYHELAGTFKYYKDKKIKGFDSDDIGIHQLYLFPENNCIHITIKGIKHNYNQSHYILMKVG